MKRTPLLMFRVSFFTLQAGNFPTRLFHACIFPSDVRKLFSMGTTGLIHPLHLTSSGMYRGRSYIVTQQGSGDCHGVMKLLC